MKFICKRDLLSTGIINVQKAIANKTNVSVLCGILVEIENDVIKLTGYNMEQSIEYTINADVYSEGKIVVDASFLGEIVRKCNEEEICFEADNDYNITLKCGHAIFNFKGITAEAYPKLDEIEERGQITILQKDLKNLIKQTIFACSDDNSRRNLMGCFFEINANDMNVVAIDGYRMALRNYQNKGDKKFIESKFIVPSKHLKDLISILDEEGIVSMSYNESKIVFDFGRIRMTSRLIQENFLNFNAIIPTNFNSSFEIETKLFCQAMERSMMMSAADRRYPVELKADENNILQITANSNRGKLEETLEIVFEGEKIDMDFNPRYLYEALKSIDDERIRLNLSGKLGPVIIRSLEDNSYIYLILPLRK